MNKFFNESADKTLNTKAGNVELFYNIFEGVKRIHLFVEEGGQGDFYSSASMTMTEDQALKMALGILENLGYDRVSLTEFKSRPGCGV